MFHIPGLCAEEAVAQEQTGQVEECLKANLLKIKHDLCKKEVLNMLKESKADVFVDPVLHTACALDLKHQCAAVTPGRGRQMSCLLESLQDKKVRLQPECKKRLQDRMDMWSYAAKVAPAEGFSDLAMQVMISPSKNYILFIISWGWLLLDLKLALNLLLKKAVGPKLALNLLLKKAVGPKLALNLLLKKAVGPKTVPEPEFL
ncbi:Golgi apparatus protein 1-like [Oncorhynchus nerka]|uniref:Golgi apparatus protein 1-like n=1 Tax=Oncorhynchus nerka TaxID=8023 RepID=UPI0031B86A6D